MLKSLNPLDHHGSPHSTSIIVFILLMLIINIVEYINIY